MQGELSFDDVADSADSEWEEVPQDRFLSWSNKMQLQYCINRDYDSAEFSQSADDIQFYLDRIAGYERMMKQ